MVILFLIAINEHVDNVYDMNIKKVLDIYMYWIKYWIYN